jgi:hypothetical protein
LCEIERLKRVRAVKTDTLRHHKTLMTLSGHNQC